MTVISKVLGDKKPDNLEQPLVENIVIECAEVEKIDTVRKECGRPSPVPKSFARYLMTAEKRMSYLVIFLIFAATLVMTMLVGSYISDYYYRQYRMASGNEDIGIYRAWGTISYGNPVVVDENEPIEEDGQTVDGGESDIFSRLIGELSMMSDLNARKEAAEQQQSKIHEIKAQFELDLNKGSYEKINIPQARDSRFVHDFYKNITAIVDGTGHRCFLMPLNRSVILPPTGVYDLVFKMSEGYYAVDTDKIREDWRVLLPAVTDVTKFGIYISSECENFDTYELEKIEDGDRAKRSVVPTKYETFEMFAGNVVQYNVQVPPEAVARR